MELHDRENNLYAIRPIHEIDARFDGRLSDLMGLLPEAPWSVEASRLASRRWGPVGWGNQELESGWRMVLVLQRSGWPMGLYGAHHAPQGCVIRVKTLEGAELRRVDAHVNVGPSVTAPEVRGIGLYSKVYQLRWTVLQSILNVGNRANAPCSFLVGVMGDLTIELNTVYAEWGCLAPVIPRRAFSAGCWDRLGAARNEAKPAEVLARRYGFREIGFKKSNGGPVFLWP